MANRKIEIEGLSITVDKSGFVSLTDIAKRSSGEIPAQLIKSWLRNQDTITYLLTWEKLHNPDFNMGQMAHFRNYAAINRNSMSAKIYIEQTGAIGITAKAGRYGGTYAHTDIALEFCGWLSAEFKVYVQKEFQRLKNNEAQRLGLQFDLRRELAKANYPLHTEAVKKYLTSAKTGKKNKQLVYANEADLLNVVLFGCTAREWQERNPEKKGNIRDYATIEELMILANIEFLNSKLLQWDCDQEQRADLLAETVQEHRKIYSQSKAVQRIKAKAKEIK